MTDAGRLLALDLGTRTGWASFDGEETRSGAWKLPRAKSPDEYGMVYHALWRALCAQGEVLELWAERPHLSGPGAHARLLLGGLLATTQLWCEQHGVPSGTIAVSSARKAALGSGGAKKHEVFDWAVARWPRVKTTDEADALCVLAAVLGGRDATWTRT